MAFTMQHPEIKINHAIVLGSREGSGKDWLITPLIKGMEGHTKSIRGDMLTSTFNKYLLRTKLLIVNETEVADHRDAITVGNKLKEMAAAPPATLQCEGKGKDPIEICNIVNLILTTNSRVPIKLHGDSRRYFMCWSDNVYKDTEGNLLPGWSDYWDEMWEWMEKGGADAVIYYLRNLDVSMFRAGAPPPVTDALRELQDAGKSPLQVTIEKFIVEGMNNFRHDLVTNQEILDSINMARAANSPMVEVDQFVKITGRMVHEAMSGIHGTTQRRVQSHGDSVKIWSIREHATYAALTSSELYRAYLKEDRSTLNRAQLLFKKENKL